MVLTPRSEPWRPMPPIKSLTTPTRISISPPRPRRIPPPLTMPPDWPLVKRSSAGIPNNTTITAIDGTTLTLTLSNNATASATVPAVTSSTATLNLASNTTYAGQLANSADGTAILALIKNGIGNLTLTADNSMTGGVTVNAGASDIGHWRQAGPRRHGQRCSADPATLTVSGGSLTASVFRTSTTPTGVSTLVVSSGTANFNAGLNALGNANTPFSDQRHRRQH